MGVTMLHRQSKVQPELASKTKDSTVEESTYEQDNLFLPAGLNRDLLYNTKLASAQRTTLVQNLARHYGNRELQRILTNSGNAATSNQEQAAGNNSQHPWSGKTYSFQVELKPVKSVKIPASCLIPLGSGGPGDYPGPTNSGALMAMRTSIQRDDDKPEAKAELSTEVNPREGEVSLTTKVGYDNLVTRNLLSWRGYPWLNFNLSPELSLTPPVIEIGGKKYMIELGTGLVQTKSFGLWNTELQVQAGLKYSREVGPELKEQMAGSAQVDWQLYKAQKIPLKAGVSVEAQAGWKTIDPNPLEKGFFVGLTGTATITFSLF